MADLFIPAERRLKGGRSYSLQLLDYIRLIIKVMKGCSERCQMT